MPIHYDLGSMLLVGWFAVLIIGGLIYAYKNY